MGREKKKTGRGRNGNKGRLPNSDPDPQELGSWGNGGTNP